MDIIDSKSVYCTNFNDYFSDYSYVMTNELLYTELNEPSVSIDMLTETETMYEDEHNSCTESCISVQHYSNQNSIVLAPFQNSFNSKDSCFEKTSLTKTNINTRIQDFPVPLSLLADHIFISAGYSRDEIYLSIDQYLLENSKIFSKHFNIKNNNVKEEFWLIQILNGVHYSKCMLKLYYNSIYDNFFLICEYLNGCREPSQLLFHEIFHIFKDSEIFLRDTISFTSHYIQDSSTLNVTNFQFYNNPDNIKLIDELLKSLEISNYPDYQRNAILIVCDLSQDIELHKLLYSKNVVKIMIDVCIKTFSDETSTIHRSSYEISELIMYILSTLSNFLVYREAYVYMKASKPFSKLLHKFCMIDICHDDLELIIRSISERICASMIIF